MLRPVCLATSLWLATACGAWEHIRAPEAPPPAPTPAALAEFSRASAPDFPLAVALRDDAIVRVVGEGVACSGALVSEELVLTAHHCVTERDEWGDLTRVDAAPDTLRVELGGDYLPWGEIGVRAVVAPPCGHVSGDGDIAVIVLERALVGVPTLEPRLDHAPVIGEEIEPVGFGRCALSSDGIRRRHRVGGAIDRLDDMRFRLDAGICPGDSGGPALSHDHGDVVGVISAGIMDGSASTRGRAEFTRLDAWRSVFATAKLIAEGASPAEVPPVDCVGPGSDTSGVM